MPSHIGQPRFRQVNWHGFETGGYEGRNVLSSTRKKPLEPITRLDLDVKAGLKASKFDLSAFRAQIGQQYESRPRYTPEEWEALVKAKNPVPMTTEEWNEHYLWRGLINRATGQHQPPAWWPTATA